MSDCAPYLHGGASPLAGLVRNLSQLVDDLLTDSAALVGPSVDRPDAVAAGAGGRWYDTTLSLPLWSDGAVWRDAVGTAV